MPTTIIIDGVTLTLKKYPEFAVGTPVATDITLFSDPVNGDLFKTTMDNLIANILYVDGVTITGNGSSGNPLVGSGIAGITADNGLTASTATNVQLFGPIGTPATLLNDRYLNATTFNLNITGTKAGPDPILSIANTGTGKGLTISSIDDDGLQVTTTNNYAISANSTAADALVAATQSGIPINATINNGSTNSNNTAITIVKGTSVAANGISSSIDWSLQNVTGGINPSNQLISKWTDAILATRTSQFIITGILSAAPVDLITLNADGSWQIRPITAAAASAITPAEGMMLFVSNTDATFTSIGFWGYRNGAWAAF